MKENKVKKNVYVPDWVSKTIDTEGEFYGGPGVVIAASVCLFSRLSQDAKQTALENFRKQEIAHAFGKPTTSSATRIHAELDEIAAEAKAARRPHHKGRPG
jgi:hypothetical protein